MSANPYQPPTTPVADIHSALTEQDVLDFTGDEYYWPKWEAKIEGRSNWVGFNFAAALFSSLWCLYRRMYLVALVWYFGSFIVSAACVGAAIYFFPQPGSDQTRWTIIATWVPTLVLRIAFGLIANRVYLERAVKAVDEVNVGPGEVRSARLIAAGRTSAGAVWIGIGISVSITIGARILQTVLPAT